MVYEGSIRNVGCHGEVGRVGACVVSTLFSDSMGCYFLSVYSLMRARSMWQERMLPRLGAQLYATIS